MFWEKRLNELGLKVKLFSDYDAALDWIVENKTLIPTALFIADYNLAGTEDGLMFLEKIENNNHRYLITDSAETTHCQRAVAQANVWLIPKSLSIDISLAF